MCNQDTCVYFHWPPSVVIGNRNSEGQEGEKRVEMRQDKRVEGKREGTKGRRRKKRMNKKRQTGRGKRGEGAKARKEGEERGDQRER